jgi:hypothetical protein
MRVTVYASRVLMQCAPTAEVRFDLVRNDAVVP